MLLRLRGCPQPVVLGPRVSFGDEEVVQDDTGCDPPHGKLVTLRIHDPDPQAIERLPAALKHAESVLDVHADIGKQLVEPGVARVVSQGPLVGRYDRHAARIGAVT